MHIDTFVQAARAPLRRVLRIAAVLAAACIVGQLALTPALADYNSDLKLCFGGGGDNASNDRVGACTRVIESGRMSQRDKAGAYNWRGEANRILERYELALADYARSIRTRSIRSAIAPRSTACRRSTTS